VRRERWWVVQPYELLLAIAVVALVLSAAGFL
jgi:hypothetical protein